MIKIIKGFIDRIKYNWKIFQLKQAILKTKKESRLFLFQTPAHTNIGDHAIAEAEIVFIKRNFPNRVLIEINQVYHFKLIDFIKSNISCTDILLLHGGGNLGNQYLHEERIRRSVIENFSLNKIIIFPQTIYYTSDEIGQKELSTTQQLFKKHKKLTLIAREDVSNELMTSYFPFQKVLLMPDIVFSLNRLKPELPRKGALMVLRNDEEKILNSEQHNKLDNLAKRYFETVTYSDMHYHKWVRTARGRAKLLQEKFNQFKSAEIVITDRLHGMVFAAITGTPCIAFSNYNQKVSGTYKWIENLNYIKFLRNIDNVEQEINELNNLVEKDVYDESIYKSLYSQIITAINE